MTVTIMSASCVVAITAMVFVVVVVAMAVWLDVVEVMALVVNRVIELIVLSHSCNLTISSIASSLYQY